jgi:hypothetical protein
LCREAGHLVDQHLVGFLLPGEHLGIAAHGMGCERRHHPADPHAERQTGEQGRERRDARRNGDHGIELRERARQIVAKDVHAHHGHYPDRSKQQNYSEDEEKYPEKQHWMGW